jgi:hypothetical protein
MAAVASRLGMLFFAMGCGALACSKQNKWHGDKQLALGMQLEAKVYI